MGINGKISKEDSFYVSDWLIEPSINRIRRGDIIHKVEPRIINLVIYLANRPLQICTKEEIVANVWKGVVISDNTLSSAIKSLRKIFNDDWKKPRFIETVSKSGYRLIAEISLETIPKELSSQSKLSLSWPIMTVIALAVILVVSFALRERIFSKSDPSKNILRPITISALPGPEFFPKISPDGNQVAFAWQGLQQDDWNIYVKSIGGEGQTQLTFSSDNETHPAWSSDGQFIFYKQTGEGNSALYKVSVLGGAAVKIMDCDRSIAHISNSPDGRYLVYDKKLRNVPLIAQLDLLTMEEKNLTEPDETSFGDRNPAFSPNGMELAFVRDRGPLFSDIFIEDVKTGEIRKVTNENRFIASIDWTNDNEHLVLIADWAGTLDLWRIGIDSEESDMIFISGESAFNPSYARQTDRMVYANVIDDVNIWKVSINSDSVIKEALPVNSTQQDLNPQISPDNSKLAFVSDRTGSMELYTCDLQGNNLIQHTNFKEFSIGMPQWSPASDKLIFHKRTAAGNSDIFYVEVDSKQPRQITFESANDLNGSWSKDGHSVYFTSNRSGSWQIWKKDLRNDSLIKVTFNGGFNAFENSDGNVLFFVKYTEGGIWRKSLIDANEELIISDIGSMDRSNWKLTDKGIYFIKREPNSHLAFYDFETKTIKAASDTTQSIVVFGLSSIAISSDEKFMFYNRPDSWRSDILLLENLEPSQSNN